jgi:hypothetical protein
MQRVTGLHTENPRDVSTTPALFLAFRNQTSLYPGTAFSIRFRDSAANNATNDAQTGTPVVPVSRSSAGLWFYSGRLQGIIDGAI